jgi:hypothetical protein
LNDGVHLRPEQRQPCNSKKLRRSERMAPSVAGFLTAGPIACKLARRFCGRLSPDRADHSRCEKRGVSRASHNGTKGADVPLKRAALHGNVQPTSRRTRESRVAGSLV